MFKHLLARAQEARAAELEGESGLEGGFTLIELMVVLLIIAILLAIAIPTFLGVSGSARDRSAQSNVTNALTNAIAYYQNGQTFDAASTTLASQGAGAGTTSAALQTSEPAFTWQAAACATNQPKCVSVAPVDVANTNDGQGIILAVRSGTGSCWYALNMQTNPAAYALGGPDFTNPTGAFGGKTTPQSAMPQVDGATMTSAGTYYASEGPTGTVDCSAAHGQDFTNWYSTYAKAGANPE
jgi:type IV pilus assembly protein PilA